MYEEGLFTRVEVGWGEVEIFCIFKGEGGGEVGDGRRFVI